jgi:hypothetical protein
MIYLVLIIVHSLALHRLSSTKLNLLAPAALLWSKIWVQCSYRKNALFSSLVQSSDNEIRGQGHLSSNILENFCRIGIHKSSDSSHMLTHTVHNKQKNTTIAFGRNLFDNACMNGVNHCRWPPAGKVSGIHATTSATIGPEEREIVWRCSNKSHLLFGSAVVTQSQSQSCDNVIVIKVSHYGLCLVTLWNTSSFPLQCLFWK